MPNLKIRQPSVLNDQTRHLPPTFLAAGRVQAKVNGTTVVSVQVVVQTYPLGGPLGHEQMPVQKLLKLTRDHYCARLRWIVRLQNVHAGMPQRFRLTVRGLDAASVAVPGVADSVDFWIGSYPGHHPSPSVDFPPSGYHMTADDKNYFLAWGGSTLPITEASLGSAPATNVEWSGSPDNSWWAEFDGCGVSPGPDADGYWLKVCNAEGCTASTYVVHVD
jgi:hypothetical protein